MKRFLSIILFLLTLNLSIGQNQDYNTELCIINMLGAKVYEEPSFDSNVLTEFQTGETIIVEKSIKTKESFIVGNGFSLSGNWIKPQNINGFIFSSDLTNKNAEIAKNKHGQTFINLMGNLKSEKSEEKIIKLENGEFPKYFEFKYYENGTYTYTAWDGCFNHVKEYKTLTLNEVYHQMVSDYGGIIRENEFWVPIFQEKSENKIMFEGEGATFDLKIEIKENGTIVVSSYDCT